MRFSACFRAVQLRGFFWPTRFISYRSRWCCLSYCEGSAYQLGLLTKRLLDGFLGKGFVRRQRPAFRRFRNTGFTLLTVHAPHITLLQGHVWNLLRQLRIRS